MDKVHDNKQKEYGRSTADPGLESASFEQSAILSPPPLQFKAEPNSEKEEAKEENASTETSHQMAAQGIDPPSENPNDGSGDQITPNNTGLPTQLKSGVENLSGYSLDDVKVHYNSDKPAQLQAKAYAQGSDIHIGPGQEKHLPHEAWHVVQQKQGRVQPTTQLKAFNINDDLVLEKEADVMGAKAIKSSSSKSSPSNLRTNNSTSDYVVQNRGETQEQKEAHLASNKSLLDGIRNDILQELQEGNWSEAITNFPNHNVNFTPSTKWTRTKLAKKLQGTLTLNPLRTRAKSLIPQKNNLPVDDITTDLKTISKETRIASRELLTVNNLGNHTNIISMVKKIAYYLINSIPNSVMSFVQSFLDIDYDLQNELESDIDSHIPGGQKTEQVFSDEDAIKSSLESGDIESHGFHGSASWLLEGLGKSDGKLLSQKAAFEAGLLKTGEGTTFSSGASLKKNVYIGKGETGMGTAASYALAPGALSSYNVSLFSDIDLAEEINNHKNILKIEYLLKNADFKVVKGSALAQIKKQAENLGLDLTDQAYMKMMTLQNTVQLTEMLNKMLKEQEDRESWEEDDPRRMGGQVNPDNYPILLEFGLKGVNAVDDAKAITRESEGNYNLAGEATVENEIDLKNGNLKVVYCPEEFIEKTKAKIKAVFGEESETEVRALESIKGAFDEGSKGEKTLKATYGQLAKQQKALNVKMKAHQTLANNIDLPDKIYGSKNGYKELTRVKAGGKETYVDKDNKPVLHETIVEMMMEGAPKVKADSTPQAILTMGGPGAGKSTVLQGLNLDMSSMVTVNSDDVKESLPEYQAGVQSGDEDIATKVHSESKEVANSLKEKSIANRHNVLYDATGGNLKDYNETIQKLKDNGYRIKIVMVHVDTEEGVGRVKTRAEETGRKVPESRVRSIYRVLPKNFIKLAPKVDEAEIYSNMGDQPEMVWNSSRNDLVDAREILGVE